MADGRFLIRTKAHDRHLRRRGDVVTADESRETGQTVMVRQPVVSLLSTNRPYIGKQSLPYSGDRLS